MILASAGCSNAAGHDVAHGRRDLWRLVADDDRGHQLRRVAWPPVSIFHAVATV